LFDLAALNLDLETVRLVNDKLLANIRLLQCSSSRQAAVSGRGDPTNLHAIDEISFRRVSALEAVIVEDDKLQRRSTRRSSRSKPDVGAHR